MKVKIFLLLLIFASSNASNCDNWPSNIASLAECCVFPHYLNLEIYAECIKFCIVVETNDPRCILHCYINHTRIITKGKFNVKAVKEIYLDNAESKGWNQILTSSIESCNNFTNITDDTIEENLYEFFSCIKNESLPECLEFYSSKHCYESEKYFLNCSHFNFNCSSWPERFSNETLIDCCDYPQIFDESFSDVCEMKCVFTEDILNCVDKCRYIDTGLVNNGKINVDSLKNRISSHRNYKNIWNDVISESIGTCLGEYYVLNVDNSTAWSYSQLEACIDFRMSAACVEMSDDYDCRTLKKFMEMCPNTKPNGYVINKI